MDCVYKDVQNSEMENYNCNQYLYKTSLSTVQKYITRQPSNQSKFFNCSSGPFEKYKCYKCKFETNLLADLKTHFEGDHVSQNNLILRSYICKNCCFQTFSKFLLFLHRKCNNNCPKSYNKSHLLGHDIRCFQCTYCSYKSKTKGTLKGHIVACHTAPEKIKWFNCKYCSYKAKQSGNMNQHVMLKHEANNIRWFECEHCPYKTKKKQNLKSHIVRKHVKAKVDWFLCGQCPRKFKLKNRLITHIKLHHVPPEKIKWFKCEYCLYICKIKSSLKRHVMLKHLDADKNIQWFQCEQCSYKTQFKAALERHIVACARLKQENYHLKQLYLQYKQAHYV